MGTLDLDRYKEQVEKSCISLSRKIKKEGKLKNQSHYKSNLKLLGLSIPSVDKLAKSGFGFDDLSEPEKLKIWNYIWDKSEYHEVKTLALSFFFSIESDLLLKKWATVKKWMRHIENWAHADGYSSIIARLYEKNPEKIEPQLAKWNKSKSSWERRLSVVGLYYYSAGREKQPNSSVVLNFLSSLLDDEDYYVQKGVGWTLRELGNVEPKKHLSFLKKNCTRLSSIAFSTSIENVDRNIKDELKKERKKSRAKT